MTDISPDALEVISALAQNNPLQAYEQLRAFDPQQNGGQEAACRAIRLALNIACAAASPPESLISHDFVALAARQAKAWGCPDVFYEQHAHTLQTFRQAGNPHAVLAFLKGAATLPSNSTAQQDLVRDYLPLIQNRADKNIVEALQLAAALARIPANDPALTGKLLDATFGLLSTIDDEEGRSPAKTRQIDDLVSNMAREARNTKPAYGPAFVRMGFDFLPEMARRNPPLAEELMTRLQLEALYTSNQDLENFAVARGLTVAAACAGDPAVPPTTIKRFVEATAASLPFVDTAYIKTLFGILAAPDQHAARASDAFTQTALTIDCARVATNLAAAPDDVATTLPLLGQDNPKMACLLGAMLCQAISPPGQARLYRELVAAPPGPTTQWSVLIPLSHKSEPLAMIGDHMGPLSDVVGKLALEREIQDAAAAQHHATVAKDFMKLAGRFTHLPSVGAALRPAALVAA